MEPIERKRPQYVAIACESCRQRKAKCSGGHPCERCCRVRSKCVYREKRLAQLKSSRRSRSIEQDSEASSQGKHSPAASQHSESTTHPHINQHPVAEDFHNEPKGETDTSGRQSLYQQSAQAESVGRLLQHRKQQSRSGILAALENGIWHDSIQVYQEEIGIQYPVVDLDELSKHIDGVREEDCKDSAKTVYGGIVDCARTERLDEVATLVLLISAVLTDSTTNELAKELVKEAFTGAIARTQLYTVDLDDLTILILTALYFFLTHNEILAWRGIGICMRLLQEPSPNLDYEYFGPPLKSRIEKRERIYWSAYILDRCLSSSLSLPFAIRDCDIQRSPTSLDSSPLSTHLKHMVHYCRIAAAVRRWYPTDSSQVMRDTLLSALDDWQLRTPEAICFNGVKDRFDPTKESCGYYRLRLTFYLRANHIRQMIYRKSTSDLNHTTVRNIIKISQDTICILALSRAAGIYHSQHKTLNHFLEMALLSLMLVNGSTGKAQNLLYLQQGFTCLGPTHQFSALVNWPRGLEELWWPDTQPRQYTRKVEDCLPLPNPTEPSDIIEPVQQPGTNFIEGTCGSADGMMTSAQQPQLEAHNQLCGNNDHDLNRVVVGPNASCMGTNDGDTNLQERELLDFIARYETLYT